MIFDDLLLEKQNTCEKYGILGKHGVLSFRRITFCRIPNCLGLGLELVVEAGFR